MLKVYPAYQSVVIDNTQGQADALDCLNLMTHDHPRFIVEGSPLCYIFISKKINQVARRVYEELRACLWQSQEHLLRLYTIETQPRNCGSTITASLILPEATSFEQMIALENWLYRHQPLPLKHTFCLANNHYRMNGRIVPISIQKGATSMMEVLIGTRGTAHPAPVYDQNWDNIDPWQRIERENFIYHLEALEIVRQPDFIGATLIKGNAFESEYINPDWRYGVSDSSGTAKREACVEFRRQHGLTSEKLLIKTQSTAFNLLQLIAQDLRDIDLCNHRRGTIYEYFDDPEQIPTDFSLKVSPQNMLQSLKTSCRTSENNTDRDGLYYQIFKLMAAKIGPQTTPSLRSFMIQRFIESIGK